MSTDFIDVNNLVGCGDWTESCMLECINEVGPIPPIVHFIKLDTWEFTFGEWVAVMSARKFIKPKKILIYSVHNITNSCWWRQALPFVEHHILPREVLIKKLNGVHVKHLAHHADFIRNSLLYHVGGVYADIDIIMVKPFDELFHNHQAVVSKEAPGFVGNGLILARRNSCFMCMFARKACENFDGWWISHSTITLHRVVEQKELFRGLFVLTDFMRGFFPISCSPLTCEWKLYDASMKATNFNISQVYSVHLMSSIARQKQKTTLLNYEWISTSPSQVAAAVRKVLPQWFNATHLDETRCIDLPKEEHTAPTSPMFILEGIPTQPTIVYDRPGLISLLPRAYILCIPSGYGFCIGWLWVVLMVLVTICSFPCLLYIVARILM